MTTRKDRIAVLAQRLAHEIRRRDLDFGRDGRELLELVTWTDPALTRDQIEILHHSLGYRADQPRSGGYRNGYAPSWPHEPAFDALIEMGFLRAGARYNETHYYHVTEEGARAAGCLTAWRRHQRQR